MLSEQSFASGTEELTELWSTGGWISWLGGPAAAPLQAWPRRADGAALAHVLTLDLGDLDGVLDAQGKAVWPGLREGPPTVGVLEVFHDLQTYGVEPGDRGAGAWLVRWVAEPERSVLVEPPADLGASAMACQAVILLPGFTLPPAADTAGGPVERFKLAQLREMQRKESWTVQRTAGTSREPGPITHVYVHRQTGVINALARLATVLPLTVFGDEHRLVLDVECTAVLEGWFGDCRHLKVWMRASDLAARDFAAAWCLLRTG
ncbi:DUF1963 domain-containing protein [Kocuria oceani]|uniref:DUF1963 domain-containing protein n=1 Tax=Kocuria oceani TaxID=988827 RepID=UPI004035907D